MTPHKGVPGKGASLCWGKDERRSDRHLHSRGRDTERVRTRRGVKKKVQYIRPGFGRKTAEERLRRRRVAAVAAVEALLLAACIVLMAGVAGGAGL